MRNLAFLTISLIFFASCADKNHQVSVDLQEQNVNLFTIQADGSTVVHKTSLLGLWQSNAYQDGEVQKRIRWRLDQNQMTIAKECTYKTQTVVAQVSVPVTVSQENVTLGDESGSTNTSQQTVIRLINGQLPEPITVEMAENQKCVARIGLIDDHTAAYYIEDSEEFYFTGDITNGTIEFNIIVDAQPSGILTKIQD